MENKQIGVPRTSPEFNKVRRLRFCKLLREAKRILNFSPQEREEVIKLCKLIEKNSL